MLSPTYEITTALSHTDELISPPYDIAIVTISYGRVTMSSVWDSMMSKKNMGWPFYAAVKYHWKWAFIVWKKTNNWQHIVFSSKFIPLLYLFVINSNKIHNNAMSYESIHLYISEIYLFIIDFSPCILFFIPLFSIGLGDSYFRGFLFNSGRHPKNTSSQFCNLYMYL